MSDTSLVFNLLLKDNAFAAKLSAVVGAVETANKESANSAEKASSSNTRLKASTVAMIAGWTAAIGPAGALVSVLGQLAGGAAVALPAFAVTGVAAIGAFRLGVLGLGAALKTSAGSAGGAAFDYAGAEHRVEQALQRSLDAQKALDQARQDATRNIDDLSRSLRGATLDEEGAALAVTRAEQELRKAKRGGNRAAIQEADLAYRQSLQTLDEARHRTQDLATQQADAAAKGVEGADAVQQAIRQQADATYELGQAQQALKKGGSGGGSDPAAAAFAKLAPAAQALVTTVKQITPAWQGLQRSVQQAVWAGVAGDLRTLSATYLPVATTQLTRFGGAWNIAMRESAALAKTPSTVRLLNTMLGNGATAAQTLARSFAPVVSSLIQAGAAGSGILPMLANDALRLAQGFERWITAARQSGRLASWAQAAYTSFKSLAEIAWNVGSAVIAIVRAGGSGDGQSMLAWLADVTGKMADFLNSTKGQEKIATFFEAMRGSVDKLGPALNQAHVSGQPFFDALKVSGPVLKFAADHIDLLVRVLPYLAAGYLLVQAGQLAANAATVASVPIKAIDLARNWGMVAALRAHTSALVANTAATEVGTGAQVANTAATNVGTLSKIRAIAQTVALKVAELAGVAVRAVATAAQWALNVAMSANPIALIIIALVALGLAFVWLWNHSETFRTIVIGTWEGIKWAALTVWHWMTDTLWPGIVGVWNAISSGAGAAIDWIVGKFNWWVDLMTGIRTRVVSAVSGVWDLFVSQTKGAINTIISLWNRLDFGIHVAVPDWVPYYGGRHFDIDDIIPDIPMLASGGNIQREGLVYAHAGERVTPAAEVTSLDRRGGGGQVLEVRFAGNADTAAATSFKQMVRGGLITFTLLPSGQIAVG